MHVISIAGQQWLTQLEELQLAILQTAAPSDAVLLADQPRPNVIGTLSALISDGRQLGHILPGATPAVVALPELALSFEEWNQVDDLIRAQARPLIIVAGFGFTLGAKILGWLAAESQTVCGRSWALESDPQNGRTYNGGWVWVHRPGHPTQCIAFLKRTAEQSREIQVPNLTFGNSTLCLELDDLVLIPVICSDFLSTPNGQRLIGQEIAAYLQLKHQDARKVLIVGLLLQDKPHQLWRNAIIDVARINTTKINVCLANCAHDFVTFGEPTDRWRDYSGVYIAQGRSPTIAHFTNVRRFSNDQIDAAVLRTTDPMVIGGPIRWTFSQVERHLWANPVTFGLAADGTLRAPSFPDEYQYEAVRFVKRATLASDSPLSAKTALAQESFREIEARFKAAAPNAQAVCEKTLMGESHGDSVVVSADQLSENLNELTLGLKAIGALKRCPTLSWQADINAVGQLQTVDARILVWANPGRASTVRNKINTWRLGLGLGAPVLIFHKSFGGSYPPPDPISDRRRDVSAPPEAPNRSAAEPVQGAMIAATDLDDIDMCLDVVNSAAMVAALQQQLMSAMSQCGKS